GRHSQGTAAPVDIAELKTRDLTRSKSEIRHASRHRIVAAPARRGAIDGVEQAVDVRLVEPTRQAREPPPRAPRYGGNQPGLERADQLLVTEPTPQRGCKYLRTARLAASGALGDEPLDVRWPQPARLDRLAPKGGVQELAHVASPVDAGGRCKTASVTQMGVVGGNLCHDRGPCVRNPRRYPALAPQDPQEVMQRRAHCNAGAGTRLRAATARDVPLQEPLHPTLVDCRQRRIATRAPAGEMVGDTTVLGDRAHGVTALPPVLGERAKSSRHVDPAGR